MMDGLEKISCWVFHWKMIFRPHINKQAQEVVFSGKLQKSNYPSLTFNGTCVTQSEIQKHLEMFLESKLDFKEHIQNVFNGVGTLYEKPYFLFPNILKSWSFQRNRTGIWSLLYFQERWYFFFPKIRSHSLDTKGKMIFLKKTPGNMIFSSGVLKRWSFQKNSRLNMIFFVISGKMVFLFSRKYDIFSLGGKWKKMIFIKKRVEIWYFLHICVDVTGVALLPPDKKNPKMPRKNAPKGDISGITEKDDIYPRFTLDSSYFC